MASVKNINTSEEFMDIVSDESGGKYIFVDFYADWCGPCLKMAPVVDRLATEFPKLVYLKVNIDHVRELANTYQISSIPTFCIFRHGKLKPVDQILGANEQKIRGLLAKYSGTQKIRV